MTALSPIHELVLSRNEVRNAPDLATTELLLQAIAESRDDPAVRALLLRGEGTGFRAGSDVK